MATPSVMGQQSQKKGVGSQMGGLNRVQGMMPKQKTVRAPKAATPSTPISPRPDIPKPPMPKLSNPNSAGASFARGVKRLLGTPARAIPRPLLRGGLMVGGLAGLGAAGYGLHRHLDTRARELQQSSPEATRNRARANTLRYGSGNAFNPSSG